MACNSISAVTYDACQSSLGGVKAVWVANYDEGAASVDSAGTISAFTMSSGNSWQKFTIRKNTASMTSTLNVGDEGGTFVSTVLSMVFSKMETPKRLAIQSLILGEAMVVVEDCNGIRWFLGKDNPVTVGASEGVTGTQKTDPNHYTLELNDEANEYPYQVSGSVELD